MNRKMSKMLKKKILKNYKARMTNLCVEQKETKYEFFLYLIIV